MVKFYEQICEQDRLNYIKDLKRSIDFNTYPKMLEFMQNEQLYITNVKTGKPEYVKLTDLFAQMEVLRATSAMPFVSESVEIDGKEVISGSGKELSLQETIIKLNRKHKIIFIIFAKIG